MKVLVFTGYLTEDNIPDFSKNKGGFGYMVRDITFGISTSYRNVEIDVITQSNFTNGKRIKNVNFLKKSKVDVIKHVSFKIIFNALFEYIRNRGRLSFIRHVLYKSTFRFIKSRLNQYEVIHIHGLTYYTFDLLNHCLDLNLNTLVTIHGVNFLNDSIGISLRQKSLEKASLIKISRSSSSILTVISSGIVERIKNQGGVDIQNFMVVPNFVLKVAQPEQVDVRSLCAIPKYSRIILNVGNYSENKNQLQMLKAFELLADTRDDTYLVFVGADDHIGTLAKLVRESKVTERIRLLGFINQKRLASWYSQSDILVVVSISEGFGLPIVEAGLQGCPTVVFDDLDAVKDIYSPHAMITIKERKLDMLVDGMNAALEMEWERVIVKECFENFKSSNAIVKYYQALSFFMS